MNVTPSLIGRMTDRLVRDLVLKLRIVTVPQLLCVYYVRCSLGTHLNFAFSIEQARAVARVA